MRRERKGALLIVVGAIFAVTFPAPSRGVGTGVDKLCPISDPFCEQYEPACMTCENIGGQWRCPQVSDGETGQDNCRVIYNGAVGISCSAWGQFCSQITVHP